MQLFRKRRVRTLESQNAIVIPTAEGRGIPAAVQATVGKRLEEFYKDAAAANRALFIEPRSRAN